MMRTKRFLLICFALLGSVLFAACSRSAIDFVISFESNGGSDCAPVEFF
jgi:ABC-type oligopeptide transport system substrate-binding subunit